MGEVVITARVREDENNGFVMQFINLVEERSLDEHSRGRIETVDALSAHVDFLDGKIIGVTLFVEKPEFIARGVDETTGD